MKIIKGNWQCQSFSNELVSLHRKKMLTPFIKATGSLLSNYFYLMLYLTLASFGIYAKKRKSYISTLLCLYLHRRLHIGGNSL